MERPGGRSSTTGTPVRRGVDEAATVEMKSALREWERDVLRRTGMRLAGFGFSARPRGQSFLRAIDGGQASVHLSFIEHEHDFDVTADVAIRFDAVEDLVNRSNVLLSRREKASTFTMGAELGNLERGEPFRVTVAEDGDVEPAVERLVKKIETVGLPYLEKYSDLEAAYEVLSRDDRDGWIHSPIHAGRARRACALLVVMGRQSEVQALGRQKLSYLESVSDPGAALFSRFLAELQGR